MEQWVLIFSIQLFKPSLGIMIQRLLPFYPGEHRCLQCCVISGKLVQANRPSAQYLSVSTTLTHLWTCLITSCTGKIRDNVQSTLWREWRELCKPIETTTVCFFPLYFDTATWICFVDSSGLKNRELTTRILHASQAIILAVNEVASLHPAAKVTDTYDYIVNAMCFSTLW